MKKLTIFLSITLLTLSACNFVPTKSTPQITATQQKEIIFSDNILFSINNGAAGYGTRAECTDAEIYIYTDRTIKIFMVASDYSTITEIASLEMSEKDYARLTKFADREDIYNLQVKDGEADDGNSSYITLYDENDNQLVSKGGYMPVGDEFWEIYKAVKDILKAYDIEKIVDSHRKILENN